MSENTTIEWTHRPGTIPATMNALVGCQKVSEGCRICYAIGLAHVRAGNPLPVMQEKFAGTTKREGGKTVWTGVVTLTESALLAPLKAKKPHTYFVNAMSDLFYDGVSDEVIDRHFAVFALCSHHTMIVLTKRPARMSGYLSSAEMWPRVVAVMETIAAEHGDLQEALLRALVMGPVMPNVWLGVSVENQKTADERIPLLLQTPAVVRFISAEPLLGLIDLESVPLPDAYLSMNGVTGVAQPLIEKDIESDDYRYHTRLGFKLDWVIVGGESGPGARPMHPEWARSLRDQCVAAGVPFFFKQWGEWAPCGFTNVLDERHYTFPGPVHVERLGKKAAGHLLDGKEWHQFPEVRS